MLLYGARHQVEFKRGNLRAKNTLDQYTKHTNYELGEIRLKLASIKDEKEKLLGLSEKLSEIEATTLELAKASEAFTKIEF